MFSLTGLAVTDRCSHSFSGVGQTGYTRSFKTGLGFIFGAKVIIVILICLSTEHIEILKNSLKCVRAFQIEFEFGSVKVFKARGKLEYLKKNLL